ncbi:LysR family transcriptional regulator [Bradyrhizobium prioriisuperbiae]|uniref:LysR family transcriptional regulator n=1 Tax=Bradyrhizobium prioriisuperbiae TaxID=2854389 RepID=UPI0028E58A76|nr:LysR family transcriptional regulator [Bradyrhizobium prioritasuperba]
MNLRQLEILRAVMRTRSAVAAAQDLGMSQPAISNAIKHAESSLGFLLFDRVNKRLIPTQEAQILLAEAEPLFLMQDLISQTAAHLRAGSKGRMRIVATSELSETLLPQVVARFSRDHQGVEVSLETMTIDRLLEYVEIGIVDVGFAMEPNPRQALDCLPLAQLDMVCACHEDSPLTQLSFVSPTDLRDLPLISAPPSGSRINTLVREAFRRSATDYAPAFHVRFMNVAGHFVEEGLGVAIIDELTASSKRYSRLRSLPFKPKTQITVSAIVASERPQQRLTQALIRHAREEIAARLTASTA